MDREKLKFVRRGRWLLSFVAPCRRSEGPIGSFIPLIEEKPDAPTAPPPGLGGIEEPSEIHRPMAPLAAGNDPAGANLQRCKEVGGAVTRIVVGAPPDLSRTHRHQRHRTVQSLDARLSIDAQDQGLV